MTTSALVTNPLDMTRDDMLIDDEDRVPNAALLAEAVAWVEEQEAKKESGTSQWHQMSWLVTSRELHSGYVTNPEYHENTCGSLYCVAGYIASHLAGKALDHENAYVTLGSGEEAHVGEFAGHHLGLNEEQRDRLFHSENSAEDIRQIAEYIVGRPL